MVVRRGGYANHVRERDETGNMRNRTLTPWNGRRQNRKAMGQWKDTTAAAEMLKLFRCQLYLAATIICKWLDKVDLQVAIDGYGARRVWRASAGRRTNRSDWRRSVREARRRVRKERERHEPPLSSSAGFRGKSQSRQAISSLEIAGARVHRAEISRFSSLLVQLFF